MHDAHAAVGGDVRVGDDLEGALGLEVCKVGEQRLVGAPLKLLPLELGNDLGSGGGVGWGGGGGQDERLDRGEVRQGGWVGVRSRSEKTPGCSLRVCMGLWWVGLWVSVGG